MNAVQDLLNDSSRLNEFLIIPPEVRTLNGYLVDTSGETWRTAPLLNNFYWGPYEKLGPFCKLLQLHTFELLKGKSDSYANNFSVVLNAVLEIDGWKILASVWKRYGEIDHVCMLKIHSKLKESRGQLAGDTYFKSLRSWYKWAYGLRIPGFTEKTIEFLFEMKLEKNPSYKAQGIASPESGRSRTSKNRREFTEVDFARIQSGLLSLEGRLNSGELVLSTGTDLESLPPKIKHLLIKASKFVGIKHVVLGWLSCAFGDRPKAYWSLRESSFEFYEVDGVKAGTVQFSGEIKRNFGKRFSPGVRAKLPLVAELVRLVPRLIQENREWAAQNGIDPECDLPLFHVTYPKWICAARQTVEDVGASLMKDSSSLDVFLKQLFGALKLRYADGSALIPVFYSFRDGNTTRWTKEMPLESVAEIQGKKSIRSLKYYVKPGIRHLAALDEVPEYTTLAGQLKTPIPTRDIEQEARIPSPYPYVQDGVRRVGVEGGCGCYGSGCPMAFDGTVDCYVCPAFIPSLDGPHEWTFKVLMDRKAEMITQGKPRSEWSRYDRHLAALGEVIRRVEVIRFQKIDGAP